ncbi:hypothetical protein C3Y87_17165 [Carbonactinospora thermoautotrophica]|uniref:Uncharacterized protein n=1 Tax=Carbonactinospora thermoautotrophica TaxID=1469144 RepID=A0A132MQW4_9ACTN|nr:hypothetical protein [Carbonactinospora thermoautotrophica]KWX00136.1 hypothetical protein TH66_14575 [Carbonactinospora thermoautotrophica]KWX01890.1 hypothetical protein LI90_2923 [Carbonactinospora thermoautotrophica]KWX09703.1 hypothetical protein TR74_07985 [Carbonactinospora thermoautotrophica]MCX9193112.1 hypothetical protein [Carbonactinospora thermoautotrophica]
MNRLSCQPGAQADTIDAHDDLDVPAPLAPVGSRLPLDTPTNTVVDITGRPRLLAVMVAVPIPEAEA